MHVNNSVVSVCILKVLCIFNTWLDLGPTERGSVDIATLKLTVIYVKNIVGPL